MIFFNIETQIQIIEDVFSSPEPLDSIGRLRHPAIVHPSSVHCQHSKSNLPETTGPIKAKFYVNSQWGNESLFKWSWSCDQDGCHAHICRTCFSMGDLGVQVFVHLSIRQHLPWCVVSATPLTVLYRSFWNFACVFVMVWGCACGLDIIVRLFFGTFSTFVNLVIFLPQCINSGYLVIATPHTILYRSFWNFAHVFSMVWRYACGLDIVLVVIFLTFSTLRTLSFPDLRFYESL